MGVKKGTGTPTHSDESPEPKQETPAEKRETEKKPPVPNRGRTFGATGTEKRG